MWPNGSYFRASSKEVNRIHCVHSKPLNDGGWIYPNGAQCTNKTSPLKCDDITTDGPTNIAVLRSAPFTGMVTEFKCCLPHNCSNESTDIIIANIFGKYYMIKCRLL